MLSAILKESAVADSHCPGGYIICDDNDNCSCINPDIPVDCTYPEQYKCTKCISPWIECDCSSGRTETANDH